MPPKSLILDYSFITFFMCWMAILFKPSIHHIRSQYVRILLPQQTTRARANSGPDTGSSQFFINLVNNTHLDTKYPVFGEVIEGMDVIDRIGKVETDPNNDRPLQDVKIIEAELIK